MLDTSVAIAWLLNDERDRERALDVRRAIRDSPRDYVIPSLFYSELVNVLTYRSSRDHSFVGPALDSVLRLGLRTISPSVQTIRSTVDWSCRGLGGYDGTFVALAQDLGGRWLTADTRAARIADEHAVTLLGWKRIQDRET